jgi:hypothetical protein
MTSGRQSRSSQVRIGFLLVGLVLIAIAVWAEPLGLDITPGFGVFQVISSLLGITAMTAAGYLFLARSHGRRKERSLLADVGIRLGLTGLLACYVAGLADMLGVGTHQGARFERPFFGPLQIAGLAIGLLLVLLGMALFWFGRSRTGSESRQ